MQTNRREFLKKSAALGMGIGAFPLIMKGGEVPASDKVVVGVIGLAGMGWPNLQSILKVPGVECGALCDVDAGVLNERAAQTEELTGKRPALYNDFRRMYERRDIDAVIIATPDHWHCLQMVYACQAGIDVYLEKPVANSIQETNIMIDAVKRYNTVVQVGQWQRSDPHWMDSVKYLHEGHIGRVRLVKVWSYVGWKGAVPVVPDEPAPEGVDYDMWLGPAPARPFNRNRFHHNFRWYWDYAGGLMTDWGVHLLDYGLFGMDSYVPDAIMSTGGKYAYPDDDMQTPDTQVATYDFGDFALIWDHTIGIYGSNYGRGHGVAFIGDHGTVVVDRSGWEMIPEASGTGVKEGLERVPMQPSTGRGLDLHMEDFIRCIKTREKPTCDIEIGGHIGRFAHLGNIAYRLGRKLYWDGAAQRFKDDREANEFLRVSYREPWKLPQIS